MKKDINNQLKELAEQLPEKWESHELERVLWSGVDLNLCGFGKQYDDDKAYTVDIPLIRLVNHYERLKDGVKRKGLNFITDYVKSVL